MATQTASQAFRVVTLAALGTLALFAARPASATTITLNLNGLPLGEFDSPLTIDGFTLTPALGYSSSPTIVNDGGTYVLGSTRSVFAGGADTLLTKNDGGVFTILSIQAAALNGDTGNYGVGISGSNGNGTNYGAAYGVPLQQSLETFDTSPFLQNVTSVDLDPVDGGNGDVIGNVVISYADVPEPASLAILGVGVAAATLRRRRR